VTPSGSAYRGREVRRPRAKRSRAASVALGVVLLAWLLAGCELSRGSTEGGIPDTVESGPLVQPFHADFGTEGYSQYESPVHGERIDVVDDPVPGSTRKVLRMRVNRHDNGPTANSRAQISTPGNTLQNGDEFWAGVSLYLEPLDAQDKAAFRDDANGHVSFAQIYGPPYAAAAPVRIGRVWASSLDADLFGVGGVTTGAEGGVTTTNIWRTPTVEGRWIDTVLHVRLSPDPNVGFVEVYFNSGDGAGLVQQQLADGTTRTHYATLTTSNWTRGTWPGNHMDLQVYRPARMPIEWMTVFFADHAIGNSLEEIRPGG
jgi:hypothetical protein